ncbi:hypothetical protein [Bradyrhizobium guangdongense]|nr:hypothetical protein [Bradyrhizobium guangdongense]
MHVSRSLKLLNARDDGVALLAIREASELAFEPDLLCAEALFECVRF